MSIIHEITVIQKTGFSHTKFFMCNFMKPFPEQNFKLAMLWAESGLLDDETVDFIKNIAIGKAIMFM